MHINIFRPIVIFQILLFIIFSQSCEKKQFEIANISTQEKDNNVLRIEVFFEINQDALIEVAYWNNRDTVKLNSLKEAGTNSFILIGLEPDMKYNFIVSTSILNKYFESDQGEFETNNLPSNFPTFDLLIDDGDVFEGYLSFRYTKKPARQVILNNKAQVVWYQDFDTLVFRPSNFTKERTLLTIENAKLIKEYDLFGNVLFELSKGEKGFDKLIHHEIIKIDDNYVTLSRVKKAFDLTAIGGGKSDTIKSDGILVLDAVGNKIWEWNIFDVADPRKDDKILKMMGDWGHANSLNVDKNGNYLVSFRVFDQIWNIDSQTGEVLWKLGLDGDFDMNEDDYFYKQHAAHINSEGDLMLFDNGNIFKPISRSLSFEVDNENKKIELKSKIVLPDSLHTFKMGSAYLIPNRKFLICASTKQKVLITNDKSDVLWMLDCSNITYRTEYLETLY